ncbi:MAG: hypothetical protein M1160_03865 [Candidatus Marsarchaeota archaeon]|jgi:hypothetical protein|nr:hypothetical protein [Candidatus Marsarchaeota archaeon]MCL5111979.1 hypothetical protein [Candidatus Marsarchaeota archaeon]
MAPVNTVEGTKKGLTEMLRSGSVEITCDPGMMMVGRAIETSLRANIKGLDVKISYQPGEGQPHLTLPDGKQIVGFLIVEELKKAALAKLGSND